MTYEDYDAIVEELAVKIGKEISTKSAIVDAVQEIARRVAYPELSEKMFVPLVTYPLSYEVALISAGYTGEEWEQLYYATLVKIECEWMEEGHVLRWRVLTNTCEDEFGFPVVSEYTVNQRIYMTEFQDNDWDEAGPCDQWVYTTEFTKQHQVHRWAVGLWNTLHTNVDWINPPQPIGEE